MSRWLTASFFAFFGAPAIASTPQDFAYGMPIDISAPATAYKLGLPFEVYRDSVSDLGDLRVFNAAHEEVAYTVMRHAEAAPAAVSRALPLFPLRGDIKSATQGLKLTLESSDGAVQLQTQAHAEETGPIEQYIVDARAIDAPLDSLSLKWPAQSADFSGRLRIDASDDLSSWRSVSSGAPVANLHAGTQALIENVIDVPATKGKYWRLTWLGAASRFELTGLEARPASRPAELRWSSRIVPAQHEAKRGDYEFDLGARLPVEKLNLSLPQTNSIYSALLWSRGSPDAPWTQAGQAGFYRLSTADGEQRNGPVAVGLRRDRYWRVEIQGDRAPASAPQLEAIWSPADLEFLAQGAPPFVLAVGSARLRAAEANLGVLPKSATVLTATLGSRLTLGGASRLLSAGASFPYQRPLLWGILIAAVLLLAFMATRLIKDASPQT